MKLSLSMIVRNEVERLGHCLDSVQGLVDEIVVADTGSTDGTADLARAKGAAVFSIPWTDDFSAARNASLERCTGDWVLVLDADEAVDARDHGPLKAACARPDLQACRLILRNYLPDGAYTLMDSQARANPGGYLEGASYAHCADMRAVRLFRRLPWVRFQSRIHEMVDIAFLERGIPLVDLDAVIHHYGFTLQDRNQAKKPLYLAMAERDARDHPGDLQRLFHLLIQAAAAEAWEAARGAAQTYQDLARQAHQPVSPTVLLVHATALQRLERHAQALEAFRDLEAAAPDNLPAVLGQGVSLERLGRREEARRAMERCIQARPDFITAHLDLADLHARGGDFAAARDALRRGLEASDRDPALWARLVRLGLEQNDVDQAVRDAWAAIQACPAGGGGDWHKLVGVFLLRQGAREEGRQVLALGLGAFPGHPDLARLLEVG